MRPESEIVAGLKRGEDAAWDLAVLRYRRDLYACSAHLLGTGADAENALQETWLAAHLKIEGFEWRGEGSLYGWLRQICVFKSFDIVRQNHRLIAVEGEILESLSVKAALNAHDSGAAEAATGEKLALVRKVIRELREPCARLLDLRELQGKSYAVLSRTLRLPIGTVMSRLARCRQVLRRGVEALLGEAP